MTVWICDYRVYKIFVSTYSLVLTHKNHYNLSYFTIVKSIIVFNINIFNLCSPWGIEIQYLVIMSTQTFQNHIILLWQFCNIFLQTIPRTMILRKMHLFTPLEARIFYFIENNWTMEMSKRDNIKNEIL